MKFLLGIVLFFILSAFADRNDFWAEQKRFPRVRLAISEKGSAVMDRLNKNGISTDNLNVIFIVYKAEQLLEVYAKRKEEKGYKKICDYSICQPTVKLGPKRRQGDMLVPEGFYYISTFNPVSKFHLSLGINYPNQSDRIKSSARNLGGDIFIHGSCVSAGCIAMTDSIIKEIYLFALHAKSCIQQKIPVYIFPFKMNNSNFASYKLAYSNYPELIDFWANLKLGFDLFEAHKEDLNISVDISGNYHF